MSLRGWPLLALLALLPSHAVHISRWGFDDDDLPVTWAGERSPRDAIAGDATVQQQPPRSRGKFGLLQAIQPANPGLPSTCMTYNQRYGAYMDSNRDQPEMALANQRNAHSPYVVVLQMHYTAASCREDLIVAIRALGREAQAVGFHFYVLHQVPKKQLAEDPEQVQEEYTREEMLALVPPDIRSVTIFQDLLEDFPAYYPRVEQKAADTPRRTVWGPGPHGPHFGITHFMQRYRSYKFAFVVEWDVRLPGSNWGQFLVAALQQGIRAKGSAADREEGVRFETPLPDALPSLPVAGLPDLIAFGSIWPSTQWAPSQVGFNESDRLEEMRAMVYGGSRRLFDALHELSLQGRSMYLESLLPAVPRLVLPGGKAVAIRVPSHGESFHCCVYDGTKLYASWYQSQASCLPLVLIHPVKNQEPFWLASRPLPRFLPRF